MIKFSDLKKGCYVLAESDGQAWQGEVTDFNNDEKEICVNNGIQDFWFKGENLLPIPVDEARLFKMNFSKVVNEDGSVKYMKDAFRILTPKQNDFTQYEIWYRNEKRQILEPIYLHQLQNHFLEMTKVHLTDSLT
ncbi:MAG: hypothetical protein ABIW47_19060 [Ginsengibacter sp.]|jgi:hypothetical protein